MFDLSIALTLSAWPALTLAVENLWGGPESLEKRDWFAGAISDLIANAPDADVDYVDQFLLQVMIDEFDVNIEDDSGEEVAAKIVGLRKLTLQGDFAMVDDMYQKWQERKSRSGGGSVMFQHVENSDDDDTDWDSEDMGDNDHEDVNMNEAPALVSAPKEKAQPRVDDDGFTEVLSKKKR